jgi:3-dehydroquinate dehydratase-2
MTDATDRPLVLLLSGPNLDLLGQREPEIYGTATLADHVDRAGASATRLGMTVEHFQSNHEGDLIEAVHGARGRAAAIVVNRHTSVVAPVADGLVAGFGGLGYELAIEAVRRLLDGGEAAPRPTPPDAGG